MSQNFSEVFQELVPSGSGQMIIKTSADAAGPGGGGGGDDDDGDDDDDEDEGDEEEGDEEVRNEGWRKGDGSTHLDSRARQRPPCFFFCCCVWLVPS